MITDTYASWEEDVFTVAALSPAGMMSALSNTKHLFLSGKSWNYLHGIGRRKEMASKKSRREERPQTGNDIFAMTAQV